MIFGLFKSKQIQFLEAVEDKNTNKVKRLIGHSEVDVNFKDDGQTPLHTAASEGYVDICNLLIEHGADVNAKDDDGLTPLYYATSKGYLDIVDKILISDYLFLKYRAKMDKDSLSTYRKAHLTKHPLKKLFQYFKTETNESLLNILTKPDHTIRSFRALILRAWN